MISSCHRKKAVGGLYLGKLEGKVALYILDGDGSLV